ncbi:MAG: hypothetical protein HY432_01500 [Candidatus Liptonbacteria bacterium]|nr:hypothetical protein [Candidatus Liptonbacteria bacterium]
MKTYVALLVAASFIFLGVFGFLAMNTYFGMGHGCLASSAYGNSCMTDNAVAVAMFHIDFLKSFSSAVIPLIFAALFFLFAFAGILPGLISGLLPAESGSFDSLKKPVFPRRHRFLDWFAVLRENIAV